MQPQVDTPLTVPDPALGPFINEVRVAIHCDTPFAEIHYTTDGSAWESTSQVYTGPFIMSNLSPEHNLVRAVATKPRMAMSPEATQDYMVKPEMKEDGSQTEDALWMGDLHGQGDPLFIPKLHSG